MLILLCVNIAVTSTLLWKITYISTQVRETKQTVMATIDALTTVKTLVSGSILDKAQLLKNGVDQLGGLTTNVKEKFYAWRQ